MTSLQEQIAGLSPEKRALLERRLAHKAAETEKSRRIPRRADAEHAPLSFSQQRLWVLDQLTPGSPLYNIPSAERLIGELDTAALEQSLSEIVRRHESLRTTFGVLRGVPTQFVVPAQAVTLPLIDLRALPNDERDRQCALQIHSEAHAPFDLTRGPVFRARLIRLAADDHILLLTLHHIVSDAWSRGLLVDELRSLYSAFVSGRPSPLLELPIQYADYAAWQRERFSEDALAESTRYWTDYLAGAPNLLALPADRPRPALQSHAGARTGIRIGADLTRSLRLLGQREEATLFMVLLAAFDALLYRYTGQEDFVVGTPVANRSRPELERLIGFFLNTLPLRARIRAGTTYRQLVRQVRDTALGAFSHQDMPFEKLVEELQPERSLSYSPVFQVLFSLQTAHGRSVELGGLATAPVSGEIVTAKFDLTMGILEGDHELRVVLEYNTDLFDEQRIDRMLGHFERLLRAATAEPDRRIDELGMLTEPERERIAVEWNRSAMSYPDQRCLAALLHEQALRAPESISLICAGERLSYRDLDERSNRLANHLRSFGVGPETLVGICVERSPELVVGLLGILKAGGAYVPLDPSWPRERLALIVRNSEVGLAVTESAVEERLPEGIAVCVTLDRDAAAIGARSDECPPLDYDPDMLAYVLHTSGSTGTPKGVQVTNRALVNFLASMRVCPGIDAADALVAVTTISFDIAGLEIWLPLLAGGRVVLADADDVVDAVRLQNLLTDNAATVLQATPATWQMLIAAGWNGTPGSLKALCGGEALPTDLAAELIERCSELWNMYGPTETTVWSAVQRIERVQGSIAIGTPIANTTMRVLDARFNLVPVGVPGELYIGGDGLARGYLNRPDQTAERFVPDPFSACSGARLYRTGDLASLLPDGRLVCLGRIDSQVKLRGFRIEPGEIESVLVERPDIREAAVIVTERGESDRRLVAYCVSAPSSVPQAAELRQYLRDRVPEYMVPSTFVFLDALPLTPNGKVNRKALPLPDTGSGPVHRPPSSAIETALAGIFCELLGRERVDADQSFFDLGGHSLLAVRLMRRIEDVFGRKLPLGVLFQSSTVAELAGQLQREMNVECWATVEPVTPQQASHDRIPLFCVARPGVNALGYVALGRHLGAGRPMYVLQSQYRDNRDRPYTRDELRVVAAEHVRVLRLARPNGPYCLAGMCEGAHIAFEMALQLQRSGEDVPMMVSLDAWPEENTRTRLGTWLWLLWSAFARARSKASPIITGLRESVRVTARCFVAWAPGPLRRSGTDEWGGRYWPGRSFVPERIGGAVTVLRVKAQRMYRVRRRDLGWGPWATEGASVYEVPGDHFSLLREPNVAAVADILAPILERVQAESDELAGSDPQDSLCCVVERNSFGTEKSYASCAGGQGGNNEH